ncbi:MAG: OmpA family protein [Treponema sp.]|nr:OmpA family protein [Treponema sp.]
MLPELSSKELIIKNKQVYIGLALVLATAFCTFAQEAEPQQLPRLPLVLSAAVNWFFAPQLLSENMQPLPGIRAGVGYDLGQFSFGQLVAGVEAGFSYASGTSPFTESVRMIPLLAHLSYHPPLRLFGEWGVRGDVGAGVVFTSTDHYENTLATWAGTLRTSQSQIQIAETRLYLTRPLPANFGLYAGGGIDLLFERSGVITLPVIQAGVTFQPPRRARPPEPVPTPPEPEPAPPPPERVLSGVYFDPNSTVMIVDHRQALDDVGKYLQDYPVMRITLRGYAALFGTPAGRQAVSQGRAQHVKDYLVQEYGISEDRITVEFFGADRAPELDDGTWEKYRAVEMTFQRIE